MLFFFSGTDTDTIRKKLRDSLARYEDAEIVRVTDAHSVHDLEAAFRGGGLFGGGTRVVVLDSVLSHEEMYEVVMSRLSSLKESSDTFFLLAGALTAAERKSIEKYAEKSERFHAAKAEKDTSIFALANALQAHKKKDLWVGYQRELAKGKTPENIHGVLFWAAKQQVLRHSSDVHARETLAQLTQLPHEARRAGFDMEYALEHFVLSVA